jgi:flagellar biosynthetic protein FlhB
MMAGGAGLVMLGPGMARGLEDIFKHWLTFDHASLSHPELLWTAFMSTIMSTIMLVMPLAVVLMIAAMAAPILIGGWMFSFEVIQVDFGKLNPINGVGRLFSVNGLIELVKAILKATLVGFVAYWVLWGKRTEILSLAAEPITGGVPHMLDMLIWTYVLITAAMLLIVAIDVPFQIWHYNFKHRMTKEEVRQEHKESEGDPQIKSRIRAMQRQMARNRMMSAVPKADVIVTNPTHYAVALVYQEGVMRAPKVVAKGSYLLAQRIRELGEENNVPILSAPPLARALYRHAELEQEIPAALFAAVAEVLAYVYQLRSYNSGAGELPQKPEKIEVPEGMDFVEEEA